MITISNQRAASDERRRNSAGFRQRRRTAWSARRTLAFLACLFAPGSIGVGAPAPTLAYDPSPSPFPTSEDLTRDSLADIAGWEPAPAPAPPVAPTPAPPVVPTPAPAVAAAPVAPVAAARSTPPRRHRRAVAQHRRHVERRQPVPASPRVAARTPPKRNPVVKFVYWWNGWVMKNFHTKVGTVLLGTIGAET